ncbi:MAG: hypothetical protein FWG51_02275 [Firmicutes bacterium]|nr:hypothetical protein [Bacillota bacterium]
MNELMDKSKLRDKFAGGPFGLLKFSFSETEMKIEARMNKKLIFLFFGIINGIAIALSIGLAIGFSEWAFLAIAILPFLITPFGFLEINERLTIDLNGVTSSGVVWPRPCKIFWNELAKVEITGLGIMFFKNEKGKVLVPFAPEVLHVVAQYYHK